MKNIKQLFLSRLMINSVLLYIIVSIYAPEYLLTFRTNWDVVLGFFLMGIIFSVLNAVIKPIITVLTLPAVIMSLGLFTLVINGLMIWLTAALIPNLSLGLGKSILAGVVMSLANFLITNLFEERN
ncbi:MAG: phage holin family protein [Candidatus Saccharibacteria bacterium]|nr:phage holin family protein [Candidatus Saccharibacteria bacterium]